jgi:hypothetical protein
MEYFEIKYVCTISIGSDSIIKAHVIRSIGVLG